MLRLLIIAQESGEIAGLRTGLIQSGYVCSIIPHDNGLVKQLAAHSPDLLLVETDGDLVNFRISQLVKKMEQERHLPVIALVTRETLDGIEGHLNVDDFLISPYDSKELILRIHRLIHRNGNMVSDELIECDGLAIDVARCEVTIENELVELTFKEYELLRFLASNKGRVFTREALLNKVWGYDYYGGDRTVDVHVRRLRSKIEDSNNTFIETVRNIGYRLRA